MKRVTESESNTRCIQKEMKGLKHFILSAVGSLWRIEVRQ